MYKYTFYYSLRLKGDIRCNRTWLVRGRGRSALVKDEEEASPRGRGASEVVCLGGWQSGMARPRRQRRQRRQRSVRHSLSVSCLASSSPSRARCNFERTNAFRRTDHRSQNAVAAASAIVPVRDRERTQH